MASVTSVHPLRHLTERDREILAALERCPLTVEQLRKLSQAFPLPFASSRRTRRRLHVLVETGNAQRFRYATSSEGSSPYYYKLTLAGLRLLRGKEAKPPTKGYFQEISVGHHAHTQHLSDFVVHTVAAAKKRGIALADFCGENTVRLPVAGDSLSPDCCFRLIDASGQPFHFVVELDNSTETVRSKKHIESWQRKVRLYEAYQDSCRSRFRVLVVTTKSRQRLDHILEVAQEEAKNRGRLLFYGTHLPEFLASSDGLGAPCFFDHNRAHVALVPRPPSRPPTSTHAGLVPGPVPSGTHAPLTSSPEKVSVMRYIGNTLTDQGSVGQ